VGSQNNNFGQNACTHMEDARQADEQGFSGARARSHGSSGSGELPVDPGKAHPLSCYRAARVIHA